MKSLILTCFLFFSVSAFAGVPKKERYFVSVCSIFKDEAPYLKEWIEYHKLLGVKHFRLYNNESADNYLEVLAPYIKKGDVCLLEWPSDPDKLGNGDEWVWNTQLSACMDAITHLSGVSKWLAIIDIDEYILPIDSPNLVSFLKNYEPFAGVLINWHNFGTSDVKDIPKGKLMIEMLNHRAEENSVYHHAIKSIVRPDRVSGGLWCPHIWKYHSPLDKHVMANGEEWSMGMIDVSRIRINHYVHKTVNYLYEHKIPNKERMQGRETAVAAFEAKDKECNKVKDTTIHRYVPELKKKVFRKHKKPR